MTITDRERRKLLDKQLAMWMEEKMIEAREHGTVPAETPGRSKYGAFQIPGLIVKYRDQTDEDIAKFERGFAAYCKRLEARLMVDDLDKTDEWTGLVIDLGPDTSEKHRYWVALGEQGFAPVHDDGTIGKSGRGFHYGWPMETLRENAVPLSEFRKRQGATNGL